MADKTFLVESSARHVHLSKEDVEALYGAGAKLTFVRDLSQPGQFVCEERLELVGPKRTISNVVVLGPERNASQVEIALTDCFNLGVIAPVRESGDIEGTPGIVLRAANGNEITLDKGVIVAKRHIHMTTADASEMQVSDKQIVKVEIDAGAGRKLIFDDVVVRVSDKFALAMHIDTDEANAASVGRKGAQGKIVC